MTERIQQTPEERIEVLSKKLESIPSRDYISRQRLLMVLNQLRQKVEQS